MSKIICHASLLKKDDYRLKGLAMSNRTCITCDLYCIEDIINILSHCPYYQDERTEMYEKIYRKCPKAKSIFEESRESILYYLLGREILSFDGGACDKVASGFLRFLLAIYNWLVTTYCRTNDDERNSEFLWCKLCELQVL